MSCDMNDNPCDICEERYCPDQLEDAINGFHNLKSKLAHQEHMVVEVHKKLLQYCRDHSTVVDLASVRPRPLDHSASLARSNLASSMRYTPDHLKWRPIQSMRMLTEDLQDADRFKVIWEQWMKDDDSLPTFEELMTPK